MTFEEFFANKIVKVLAEATSRFNFILFIFIFINFSSHLYSRLYKEFDFWF